MADKYKDMKCKSFFSQCDAEELILYRHILRELFLSKKVYLLYDFENERWGIFNQENKLLYENHSCMDYAIIENFLKEEGIL